MYSLGYGLCKINTRRNRSSKSLRENVKPGKGYYLQRRKSFYILSECSNRRAEGRGELCDYIHRRVSKTNCFYGFEVCSFAALHNVVIRQLWSCGDMRGCFITTRYVKTKRQKKNWCASAN